MRLPFLLLLAWVFVTPATAQVMDDFSDGDFTTNPPWSGDTDRFTIVPFGADFALQGDGLAQPDTISMSTPSTGGRGEWRFLFQWNRIMLSTSP